MHQSILVFRNFRYLKWAAAVIALSLVFYWFHEPAVGIPNGGTWLGYTLGGFGAILIGWLMWFGIRKRRYGGGGAPVEDWLSAHVYLGIALIFVATLHTGFQFGWNVHTAAYVLMMIVIVSGVVGMFAYLRVPELMTNNRRGTTLTQMMHEVSDLDAACREAALALGDEINQIVLAAAQNTRIGGGVIRQLSGDDPACPTRDANSTVRHLADHAPPGQAEGFRVLLGLLARKEELLARARRDVRYKAILDIWLYFHVPLSFALLGALIAHIVAVFFYW
ncbi:MAG: hypothetical protein ACSLFL_14705 [Alphaproteobacteria bacterium]